MNNIDPHKLESNFESFRSYIKYKLFLLWQLPLAFIAGLKIEALSPKTCVVSVPFRWLTQNPFKSTYFAAQAMAAELSTGLIAFSGLRSASKPISMLVVKQEAEFVKKANQRVYFEFENAADMLKTMDQCITDGEGHVFEAKSVGRYKDGTEVSIFTVTWSFKVKNKS